MRNLQKIVTRLSLTGLLCLLIACNNSSQKQTTDVKASTIAAKGSYAYDAAFLKAHTEKIIELSNGQGAKVLLSADYQGRVMTSTATGDTGISFGWLKYDLIEAKEKKAQFNPVGGEERFWLGPEGGQYSLYFKPGDSFNIVKWQVPAIIDTIAYTVANADESKATFTQRASLKNYRGNIFDINIERTVSLLTKEQIAEKMGITLSGNIHFVGFETNNNITNTGAVDWTKDKGLLSIWLLGMFTPSPETVVIIPFRPIPNARSYITDNYFGNIPAERLKIKDSVLYFMCDGKFRSKIGLSPVIAKSMAASYDFAKNVLTIIIPEVHKNASYVNSKWEIQQQPYKGDVINSYNDGPLEDGSQMGPFYEIESSSPALELKKGGTSKYKQTTCHLVGDYVTLKKIALDLLSVDLDELKNNL